MREKKKREREKREKGRDGNNRTIVCYMYWYLLNVCIKNRYTCTRSLYYIHVYVPLSDGINTL